VNQSGARWFRLVAYLMVVAAGALGFWTFERMEHESCERSNEFRRQDLPAAFEAYSYFLGDELGADPQQAREAYDRFEPTLDELFPERDC